MRAEAAGKKPPESLESVHAIEQLTHSNKNQAFRDHRHQPGNEEFIGP